MNIATSAVSLAPVDDVGALATAQGGVLARRQLRELGATRAFVLSHLRARRWRRVLPGVYAVFTGPLPFDTRVWAALLYAGPAAVGSHSTAAWLLGLGGEAPEVIDVSVPHGKRCARSRPGVRVRQSRRLAQKRHPSRRPPQTRLEDTVLDLMDEARSADQVIDLVLRACQHRLTTPARLAAHARRRKRLRWRRLLADVLSEVRQGVRSTIERRYLRDVERTLVTRRLKWLRCSSNAGGKGGPAGAARTVRSTRLTRAGAEIRDNG